MDSDGLIVMKSIISDLKVPYPVKDYSTAQSRMPHLHETLDSSIPFV